MKTWKKFLLDQEQDIIEVLENNVLNFTTLLGVISIWIQVFHPSYSNTFNNFVTSYLLVAPSTQKK